VWDELLNSHLLSGSAGEILGSVKGVDDRDLTQVYDKNANVDEASIHSALDSYTNKDDYKASDVDLSSVLDAIANLNDLSLGEIEGSAVLAREASLVSIANSIALIPTTDSVADLAPVLNAISSLNDVTPAEVRAAFDEAEFKDKNTEAEIHAWLDSYANKDDWQADSVDLGTMPSEVAAIKAKTR
jgi:hypothetical protein